MPKDMPTPEKSLKVLEKEKKKLENNEAKKINSKNWKKKWKEWIMKIKQTLTVWLRFIETSLKKPINKGIEEILILHDFNKKSSKITKKW